MFARFVSNKLLSGSIHVKSMILLSKSNTEFIKSQNLLDIENTK